MSSRQRVRALRHSPLALSSLEDLLYALTGLFRDYGGSETPTLEIGSIACVELSWLDATGVS